MIKTLLLTACMCLVLLVPAQQPIAVHFAHLDFNQGLSNNQVNCIYKGKKGFMWFGTMSGLNRFDGYSFKTFRHRKKDPPSLSDDYIEKIAPAPNNSVWISPRVGFNISAPATER